MLHSHAVGDNTELAIRQRERLLEGWSRGGSWSLHKKVCLLKTARLNCSKQH